MFRYYKARAVIAAIVIPIVLFCMGIGELWSCLRVAFGPRTLTFSEVAAEGLGGYGYVRITGIATDLRRAEVLMRGKRPEPGQLTNWEYAFIPLVSADESESAGRY